MHINSIILAWTPQPMTHVIRLHITFSQTSTKFDRMIFYFGLLFDLNLRFVNQCTYKDHTHFVDTALVVIITTIRPRLYVNLHKFAYIWVRSVNGYICFKPISHLWCEMPHRSELNKKAWMKWWDVNPFVYDMIGPPPHDNNICYACWASRNTTILA